jgi:N-methylhydantoinase A
LSKLKDIGIRAPLQLLSSSGGLIELDVARRKPIVAVESGPAAGVIGAAELAKALGQRNMLSLDMGGTTAKAGCVVDYKPAIIPEIEVGGRVHLGRVIKGSGYPVRYPSVDLAEVSAGGGTIVWPDKIGALKVGPISAGADPGPACYGPRGKDATITDANLLLGRLGSTLLGREIELDAKLAARAMEQVAKKIGMSTIETAAAAIKLVNLHMARAVDIVSLERGQDPRNFTLIAFGGAGPMHAAELAEQVGVTMVIIPPHPGLFSALGMMMTDMKYAYVKGVLKPLDDLSDEFFEDTWNQMILESDTNLGLRTREGVPTGSVLRSVDVRYLGQGYELEIQAAEQFDRQALKESFEKKHEMVYGYVHSGERLEITALRLTLMIPVTKLDLTTLDKSGNELDSDNRRLVWFADEWLNTPILTRDNLQRGRTVHGPAIFEEYDSTIIVPPNWYCRKETGNCLVLERAS